MANVTIPKSFFIKERRMYSHWRFAFWRELFQNSTDAGASEIKVELVQKENGVIGVSFDDNGTGMTREVLENVYFKLGETTKNSGSTVGGFGRARILTCFSMKNYTIHTLNNLVQGDGGSYDIAEVDPREGCLVQVEMEDESFGSLHDALQQYLSQSQMPCDVYVNGSRWRSWLYRRQLTRQLELNGVPFASMYVNKSGSSGLLVVRVNGTVMYSQSTSAKAQVIIEVDSSMSREVLTANRDGMHSQYSAVMSSFVEELSVDTVSALKPRFKRKDATIRGRGLIYSVPNSKKREESLKKIEKIASEYGVPQLSAARLSGGISVHSEGITEVLKTADLLGRTKEVVTMARISEVIGGESGDIFTKKTQDRLFAPVAPQVGEPFVNDLPDIFIVDESENPLVRKVIDAYNPEGWVVMANGDKTFNKGSKHYKLLMLWKIACQYAIDAMMVAHPEISQVAWGLGWVFCDSSEARHMAIRGGSVLMIDTVEKNGKMKYGVRDQQDHKKMMALAKHEVAHTAFLYHNEEYANMLTDIDENYDEREVYRKMREFLDGSDD